MDSVELPSLSIPEFDFQYQVTEKGTCADQLTTSIRAK